MSQQRMSDAPVVEKCLARGQYCAPRTGSYRARWLRLDQKLRHTSTCLRTQNAPVLSARSIGGPTHSLFLSLTICAPATGTCFAAIASFSCPATVLSRLLVCGNGL